MTRMLILFAMTLVTAVLVVMVVDHEEARRDPMPEAPLPARPDAWVTVLHGAAGDLELVLRPLHADERREAFADELLADRTGSAPTRDFATLWALNHGAAEIEIAGKGEPLLASADGAWEARSLDELAAGLSEAEAFELRASAAFGRRVVRPGELLAIDVHLPRNPSWRVLGEILGAGGIRLAPGRVRAGDLQLFGREPAGRFSRILRPPGESATLEAPSTLPRQPR